MTYPPGDSPALPCPPAHRLPTPVPSTREWIFLATILVLCIALRSHNLTVPLVDTSDWRQTDTAAIAYFFFHQGVHLLHPQLWHDGPGPDYTQLELQLSPALAALLAHIFGYSDTLLRIVAIGFFTAAAVPLWALVRRRIGPGAALWTALCYSLLPVGIYFGRVFQPEAAMCFFGTAALWAVDRWAERRTTGRYLLSVALLSTAVMAKLPNGMLLPAAGALAYGPELWHWRRMFSRPRILQIAALCLVAVAAGAGYTILQAHVAAQGTKYVNFIVSSLGDSYIAGTAKLWPFIWQEVLGMAVTPGGGAAALLGIVVLIRARRGRGQTAMENRAVATTQPSTGGATLRVQDRGIGATQPSEAGRTLPVEGASVGGTLSPESVDWVWAWTAGVVVYALLVLRAIRFQYYLMPILPWLAVLMGVGLDFLAAALPARLPRAVAVAPAILAVTLVASILSGGLFQIRNFWPPYMPWYTAGRAMNAALPKNALLIVSGTFNPTVLYYARRHGFRVNTLLMSDLQADVDAGARYLVDQGGTDACMSNYLVQNFPSHDYDGITVWTLRDPLPPLPTPPPFQEQPPADVGNCGQ